MADQNDDSRKGKEPNLELPSLFGRKKKKRPPADEPVTATAAPVEPDEPVEPGPEPGTLPPTPVTSTASETAQSPVVEEPVVEEPVVEEPVHGETTVLPSADPVASPDPVVRTSDDQDATVDEEPRRKKKAKKPRKPRTPLSLPRINPRAAAAVTGVVVGLIGVALALVASRGCEAVRGVGSCGGFGLFALLAILAVMVLIGSVLLNAWGLSDAASTSFLGVGMVAVLTMLFFLSSIESVWMFLVIPALAAAAFVLSWWVTDTFVEGAVDGEQHR